MDLPKTEIPVQPSDDAAEGSMRASLPGGVDAGILVLLVLPWVLLAIDPNWIYSRLLRDFWIYYGYFRNFPDHLSWFYLEYYGSRLSVILPGALVYRLFPPLVANAVLHLGLYYLCVFSLYFTLRRSCSRASSLVAAIAMGANPAFLGAIGRDYVDGFGMAYFLVALLLINHAAEARSGPRWLLAAGAVACALVIANLTYIILLPNLLVQFVILFRDRPTADIAPCHRGRVRCADQSGWSAQRPLRLSPDESAPAPPGARPLRLRQKLSRSRGALELLRAWRMTLWGGASLLLILCFVNLALGGEFWFLRPSVAFAFRQARRTGPNPFRNQLADWLPAAGHLILPVLILSLWAAARGRQQAVSPHGRLVRASYGWQYLAVCVVFAAVEFCSDGIWLQKYYYASLLHPLAYLALGAILADLTGALRESGTMTLVAATVISLLAGEAAAPWLAPALEKMSFPAITLALLPIVWGTLWVRLGRPGLRMAVVLVIILGFAGSLCRLIGEQETNMPPSLRKTAAARHRAYNRDRQAAYLAITEATTAILSEPDPKRLRFWYREGEEHGLVFDCIASAFCALQIYNVDFPSVTSGSVAPGARAIIFSSEPEPVNRARASMRAIGLDIEVISSRRITVRSIDFTMTTVRVFLPDQVDRK